MSSIQGGGAARLLPPAVRLAVIAMAAMVAALWLATAPARADQVIDSFAVDTVANAQTPDPTLAGSHPDVTIDIAAANPGPFQPPDEMIRNVRVDLPRGLAFNPQAVPACSRAQFVSTTGPYCPPETVVGTGFSMGVGPSLPLALFNLEPKPGEPGRIGVKLFAANGPSVGQIGTSVTPDGRYRIKAAMEEVTTGFARSVLQLRFFGAPPAATQPFVIAPTRCDDPEGLVATLQLDSYVNPGRYATATDAIETPTGCDTVPFDPSIAVRPAGRAAGSSPAVTVDIGIPHDLSIGGRGSATLKSATVVLPEGMSINPGVARDLTACTDAQFGKDRGAPSACPAGSKIGTAGIASPLLAHPLPGDVYVAQPKPGQLFRIFVYAADGNTRIKLEGEIRTDAKTGRVSAIFRETPELPFTAFSLRFNGGNKAVLALPLGCGTKTTIAAFEPWSGTGAVRLSSGYQVYADEQGTPCAGTPPFSPRFTAGTTSAMAGADTGFTVSFGRADHEQYLKGLSLDLPAGILGRLADFPLCPNAQANVGQCGEDSMVGGVVVSAGADRSLVNLPGRAFLTEPPQPGQIAGLAFVVPAKVGPYDLGTVVVRAGIEVNRDTSLSVQSDPFPSILEGIPLRLEQITVSLDRPGFMINPTDCSPKKITGSITSVTDAAFDVATPFQVRGCADLPFEPQIEMSTTQPATAGGTTGLKVEITPRPGDANMRVVDLILPSGVGARLEGPLQNPCTAGELAVEACPDASLVGSARAVTPVLPGALAGEVHLLENASGGGLPRLAILLRGAVAVDLVGDITLEDGRLVAHVPGVPDVPISHFVMELATGPQAVLTAAGLCDGPAVAYRSIVGHNGKQSHGTFPVQVAGCAAASESAASRKARRSDARRGHRDDQRR